MNVKKIGGREIFVKHDWERYLVDFFLFGLEGGFNKFVQVIPFTGIDNQDFRIKLFEFVVVGDQSRCLSLAISAQHSVETLGKYENNVFFAKVVLHGKVGPVFVLKDEFADFFGRLNIGTDFGWHNRSICPVQEALRQRDLIYQYSTARSEKRVAS
jgi:hypothetical protein